MKKSMKVSLIIALIFFVVGIAICGIAFVLNNGNLGGKNWEAENAQFDKSVTSIVTDLHITDVYVKYTDGDKIQVDYYDNENSKVICQEDKNVLTIKRDNGKMFWMNYLNFGFAFDERYDIKIGVPKDFQGKLDLHTSTGHVSVEDMKLKEDLNIETSTGDISVKNCEFDNVKIATATGETEIDTLTGADITLNATTGKFTAENITGETLLGSATTGDFNLSECEIAGNMKITASTGNIVQKNVVAKGSVAFTTTTGNVDLDDFTAGKEFFAETTTGNVTATLENNGLYLNDCHTNTGIKDLPVFKGDKVPLNIKTSTGNIIIKFA